MNKENMRISKIPGGSMIQVFDGNGNFIEQYFNASDEIDLEGDWKQLTDDEIESLYHTFDNVENNEGK